MGLKPIAGNREVPDDPWMPRAATPPPRTTAHSGPWTRGRYESIQVNVDEFGNNILGDAANEPSIAIDPTDPNKIVIGWRQFDTVQSNFRQAGWAYSHDAGRTWTFPGSLTPGVFGSDPVLASNGKGVFYYVSINFSEMRLFQSSDGGVTWSPPISVVSGLADKEWMAIDRTGGIGRGNIYLTWTATNHFTRSTDGGASFMPPISTPVSGAVLGTMSVGPDGELYIVNHHFDVTRSTNARCPDAAPAFELAVLTGLGSLAGFGGPNPAGLLGQAWIATDHSRGPARGNVYILGSVFRAGNVSLDVMFARSTDGGLTWSDAVRVNDDPPNTDAFQWFGTLSVAPSGRIDAIWNDTRNTGRTNLSELYYAFSIDDGMTWSENVPVSPVFDSFVGWPNQNKIGDYYDMISDDAGVNVAYAATFNDEQDVYFLRIAADCNSNGINDAEDVASGFSDDCDENSVPDECQHDCNTNGTADVCDITSGTSPDCDGNYTPDECDPDFDGDGLIDQCDPDIDGDGVSNEADACDFTTPGMPIGADGSPKSDTNGNCNVDLIDFWRFRNCLLQSGPAVPAPAEICAAKFDYDDDGHIDLADFAGFTAAFTGIR